MKGIDIHVFVLSGRGKKVNVGLSSFKILFFFLSFLSGLKGLGFFRQNDIKKQKENQGLVPWTKIYNNYSFNSTTTCVM